MSGSCELQKEMEILKRALLDAQEENSRLSDLLKVWRHPGVPPGWRLVPVEPDKYQLETAAFNLCSEFGSEFVAKHERFARAAYRELIAARGADQGGS